MWNNFWCAPLCHQSVGAGGGIITGSDGVMEPRDWYIGRAICRDGGLTHNLGRLGVKRKDRNHRQKASVKRAECPKVCLITSLKP